MERRDFLALAASAPLLATPASADDDSPSARGEPASEDTTQSGTDTIEITVQIT